MSAAASAEARQVTLTLEREGAVTISVDQRLVRSALTNLVRNAVNSAPCGGTVTVRARTQHRRDRVVIEVEDSCGGVAAGHGPASVRALRPHGAIAAASAGSRHRQQAAAAHQGVIRVQDLPGKGCIFASSSYLFRPPRERTSLC